MLPYQNFSAPQMPNPYQNFNQPMQNPYMDRMNQLQQYQQNLQMQQPQFQPVQQQAPDLSCRVVNDFGVISANDVPMDGRGAVFMKQDGTEIQWRNWSANGTIVTTLYKPILEQNQAETTNTPQMDFNALNDDVRALREDIIARLDRLEQSMTVPAAKAARVKKGDTENE